MTVEKAEELIKDLSYDDILRLENSITNIKEKRLNELKDFEFLGSTFKLEIVKYPRTTTTKAVYTGILYGEGIEVVTSGFNYNRWMSQLYFEKGGIYNTPQEAIISHLKLDIKRYQTEIKDNKEMIEEYNLKNKEYAGLIFDIENLLKGIG